MGSVRRDYGLVEGRDWELKLRPQLPVTTATCLVRSFEHPCAHTSSFPAGAKSVLPGCWHVDLFDGHSHATVGGIRGRAMKHRLLGVTASFVLVMTTVTVIGVGVSGAVPLPNATGSVACKISGTGVFRPKLTASGIPVTVVKFHFAGVLLTSGGCGATAGIPNSAGSLTPVAINSVVVNGTGLLTGPANANSCAVFSATDAVGVVKVKFA